MAGYRARIRQARDRIVAPSVRQLAASLSTELAGTLLPELAELRRILGDQGDAADEIAEINGRTLARIAAEVADLHAEVRAARQELEALQGQLSTAPSSEVATAPGATPAE